MLLLIAAGSAAAEDAPKSPPVPPQGHMQVPDDARHEGRGRRGWRERHGRHGERGEDGEREDQGRFGESGRVGKMGRFLKFMNNFTTSVQDPYQAAGLAALGIKEHYRRAGQEADAVPVLEEMLKGVEEQKMRNVILFTIRQIFEEGKQPEKALELSKQIMRENIQAAQK